MSILIAVLLIGYFLSLITNLICLTWMFVDDYRKESYYSFSEIFGFIVICFIPFFNSYTAFIFVFDLVQHYRRKI